MKLRTIVLICAGAGIPLALLILAMPITWGYGGYSYGDAPSADRRIVTNVDPGSPADRAGLRIGDVLQSKRGADAVLEHAGPAGTAVTLDVFRKDGVHRISITFVSFPGALGAQEVLNKVLGALTALVAFIVAILVVLRARDVDVGTRASTVLLLAGAAALTESAGLVAGSAWIAYVPHTVLPALLKAATACAMLRLLAAYPPPVSKVRAVLNWAGVLWILWAFAVDASLLYGDATGGKLWVLGYNLGKSGTLFSSMVPLYAIPAAAIIDAMITADDAHRTPVRWLGSMWLAAIFFAVLPNASALAGFTLLIGHYGDVTGALTVFFLAFGVAYPVLRHRLVDLNILVTRATVFGTVSAIIVGLFVAAEWLIGRIFEHSFGFSSDRGGLEAEIVTLGVVLVLGVLARSIHRFVEDRLTKTFFRKRLHALSEIERVAHEADAATDVRAIMSNAAATVQQNLQPLGTAFYLRSGERYERSISSGLLAFPAGYDYNDPPPLRLRRWQVPFEIDDESDNRHHMLFVPMTLRGELLGFLCCGPKPDRTAYLSDEIAALSLVAHHVGIASAWLSRGSEAAVMGLAPA